MDEGIKNFIKYRDFRVVGNLTRFGYFGGFLLLMLPIILSYTTIIEKIVFCIFLWFYFFVVLLYATKSNMKNRVKKNRFYGWSGYILSLMSLYALYRFLFREIHWFLLIIMLVGGVQSILWIFGIKRNIKKNNYMSIFSTGYNLYTTFSLILSVSFMTVLNVYYRLQGNIETDFFLLVNSLYIAHLIFLVGLTFIYQNHLIKKYNLYYLLEN